MGCSSCLGTSSTNASRESTGFRRKVREKQEREADQFAAHLLMPDTELQKLTGKGIQELAEYFGIPQDKVRIRLTKITDK
ncbi:ImmA/IrrE family metallo-endopeptidase [Dehalococcoides mccartyi]|uniref:ImmA/IrrE family metallo-endopeptidase n=1 Tax=Dehalococcoides mccartyi TaxID=61435 RepID=UPI0009B8F335